MPLQPGLHLGPYEIVSALGAGGMGEVYRATDTNLGRQVAIKILPEAFAQDVDRLARFEREARLLATLNHPNIAQIYGVEKTDGVRALVMELVEGPTLADRIAQGPIPVDEALPIAKQIAEALEAAHEQGIIHRDLKPATVKLRPDGTVKVLDFGLAKALEPTGAMSPSVTQSPTITSPAMMTNVGVILGTAAYMSPEQARGQAADRRADIWAFGVVVFEMLAGQRPFKGETISDTLASVLKSEPPLDALPSSIAPSVRRLLRSCLEKNPMRRLQAMGDWRLLLDDEIQARPARRGNLPWLIAMVSTTAAVLAVGTTVASLRDAPTQARTVRFQVPVPENTTTPDFRVSPDGQMIAMSARDRVQRRLWLHSFDSLNAQLLPGTDGAVYPFWSPDSAFIGFFAEGKLKKIAVAGGPPQTLCDAPDARGGTWNSEGVIVFAGLGSTLSRVSAAGGMPASITKSASADQFLRFPEFLPDGNRFLYLINGDRPDENGVYVSSLDGASPVRLLPDQSNAVYAPPVAGTTVGHLLFRREATLMAQPFHPDEVRITGEMFPLAEQVGISLNMSNGAFSASRNGVLTYGSGSAPSGVSLGWVDRTGKDLGTIGEPTTFETAALSPDETRISFAIRRPGGDAGDIWVHDLNRGVASRFTFLPGLAIDGIWSPDGRRMVFSNGRSLYQQATDGASREELLLEAGINARALDWSRDGTFVVYQLQPGGQTGGVDLWLLPLVGDRKPIPYLRTPFSESAGQISPDGRWMAYVSNESGVAQVYVQAIPSGGAKFQVSTTAGTQPRWRRDGKELFYLSTNRMLMSVPVKTGEHFEAGAPEPLFEMDLVHTSGIGRFNYQPSADGRRFLVMAPRTAGETAPVTVVLNWQLGVRR